MTEEEMLEITFMEREIRKCTGQSTTNPKLSQPPSQKNIVNNPQDEYN